MRHTCLKHIYVIKPVISKDSVKPLIIRAYSGSDFFVTNTLAKWKFTLAKVF